MELQGKALITGASGFIGKRLRDALVARGLEVVSIRRKGSPPAKAAANARSIEANYDDVTTLTRVCAEEKPDFVFHVAGVTKGVTYEDFRSGNVTPTLNLLAALAKHPPKRFVHFSSLTCYGPSRPDSPLVETQPRRPVEFYGKSKLEAEEVVEACKDVPWTILRPSGVYGPGDVDYFNLFREIANGRNVFFGNRDRWMSVVYVDDVIDATLVAATHENAVGKGYFLADGKPVTWEMFQDAIIAASGRRVRTLNLPEALVTGAAILGELVTKVDKKPRLFNRQKAIMGAQAAWTCSDEAIKRDLGFSASMGVHEGCKRTYAWYRAEKWM